MPKTLEQQFIEAAETSRTNSDWNLKRSPDPITDADAAADYFGRYHESSAFEASDDFFKLYRAFTRQRILEAHIMDASVPTNLRADFDGYGDSGNYNYEPHSPEFINQFFGYCIDKFTANFDWVNNEGGGGDISWDVSTDTLVMNGHINVTETETVMDEEVL